MTTKQYLRFTPSSNFGVIGSSSGRISNLNLNKFNFVVVPACENAFVWNLQSKEKSLILRGESHYVTCLVQDDKCKNIAVGYADGVIRIFDFKSGNCIVSFCGHRSAVSCLTYDNKSLNLASGGKDSEIVVWNVSDQAGLYRLKGHNHPVTKCEFFKERNILISSSKDTFIKFWDLDTQHCFKTLVRDNYEVLDFVLLKDARIIVGRNAENLEIWDLHFKEGKSSVESDKHAKRIRLDIPHNEDLEKENDDENTMEEADDSDETLECVEVGKLITTKMTAELVIDETERLLGQHASEKILFLYKILTPEEIARNLEKRRKKELKRRQKQNEDVSAVSEVKEAFSDGFENLQPIRTSGKINSVSITVSEGHVAKISILTKQNSIFQYELDISKNSSVAELCHSIELPGHRNFIRSLNYSSDSLSILSLSDESIKIWKKFREEQVCTHTLECKAGLCSVLVSDNTHCVIGMKNGTLQIFDINSQEMIEKVDAHENSVNCICESPDQYGLTSGSKDKSIKFWDYELLLDEKFSKTKKKLTLALKRTLQMPDEVICIKYSPDKNRIAVALLDNTVQVLFVDSLKLIFSLYGHVLPVTCMDISYDSTLIATGSEDKDIRIWSMEFGSCNKFIKKAHDKGITCLYFLPKTHMFFTGGRDYVVKQWDADNFQKIISLKGHQNDVIAMAVSPDGVTVATAAKDKSIRVWEKTEEPLVLQEEKEKEQEEEDEVEDLPVVAGESNKEVSLPGKKTMETIKSVEQLIEAIDVYNEEVSKLEEYELECQRAGKKLPPPTPHPLLIAYFASSPIRYMHKVVNKIKSSELEGTLLYLPFNYVLDFLKILCEFVDRGWEPEFCERCTSFLVRIHMGQMIAAQNFQPVIEKLKEKLFKQVYQARDRIGFAKAGCQLQQHAFDAIEEVPMFTNVLKGLNQKRKRSRKQLERPIVAFL